MFIQMRKFPDQNWGGMPSQPESAPTAWLTPYMANAQPDGARAENAQRSVRTGATVGGANAPLERAQPQGEAEKRPLGVRAASAWRLLDHLGEQDELYKRKFTNNGPIGQIAEFLPINPNTGKVDRYSDLMLPLVKEVMRDPSAGGLVDDKTNYGALLPRASRSDQDNANASGNLRNMALAVLRDAGVTYKPGSSGRPAIDFDAIRFEDQMPAEAPLPFKRLASDEEEDFQALAPNLSTDEMVGWFKNRGIEITKESAKNVFDYYRGGGKQATSVDYSQSERDYQAALDAHNAKVDAVEGKAGYSDLFGNGVVLGSKPILNGVGGGIANTLNGGDFMSGYDFASDASRSRLAQTRAEMGVPGMIAEGAGMALPAMVLPGSGLLNGSRIAAATSPFARQAVVDTAAGGIWGANNAAPGHRAESALNGGVASLVGTALGTGVTSVASRALSPTGGSAAPLYALGVRPMLGQRFAGEEGLMRWPGLALNELEQFLQKVPFFGHWVKGGRTDALDQFETGGFNQALDEADKILPDGVRYGHDALDVGRTTFDDAYHTARSASTTRLDREAKEQVRQLKLAISEGGLTGSSKEIYDTIVKKHVPKGFRNGDAMTGKKYSRVAANLTRVARAQRRSPTGDPMLADALDAYGAIMDNAARRHSPAEAVAALDKADTGYAQLMRLENAGRVSGKKGGRFVPTDLDAPVLPLSENFRSPAYRAGEQIIDDYAELGSKKLVDTRSYGEKAGEITTRGLGSAASVIPLALAALSAPRVRDAVRGGMAPAGPQRRAISEALQRRAHLGGAAVSPFATQYWDITD